MNEKIFASRRTAAAVAALLAFAASPLLAGSATPPRPAAPAVASPVAATEASDAALAFVSAAVVRSWDQCVANEVAWKALNQGWAEYGPVRIRIDYAQRDLCGTSPITYEALAASGAQVVILSDPAGGLQQYSDAEVEALRRYAEEGHNLIGTYALLANPAGVPPIDNRALAPLFGLPAEADYLLFDAPSADVRYKISGDHPLFSQMGYRYDGVGFPASQAPADGRWNTADKGVDTRYIGMAGQRRAAVIEYCAPAYRALYVTHMPEYRSGPEDMQFLYTAIVGGAEPGCRR